MFILFLSLLSSASACTYHLNQSEIYMGDRYIFFGDYLNQKLSAKGYVAVSAGEAAEYKVEMDLKTYRQGQFEHVRGRLGMVDSKTGAEFFKSADTRCYTQLCTAKDGAKVIRKSIDDFSKKISSCNQ